MKITNIKVKTPSNIFKCFVFSSYVFFFLRSLSLPLSHTITIQPPPPPPPPPPQKKKKKPPPPPFPPTKKRASDVKETKSTFGGGERERMKIFKVMMRFHGRYAIYTYIHTERERERFTGEKVGGETFSIKKVKKIKDKNNFSNFRQKLRVHNGKKVKKEG